jgi:hypothetical protein
VSVAVKALRPLDLYYIRSFSFGANGDLTGTYHSQGQAPFGGVLRDGYGTVTSLQVLPQSAKPGASGAWFTTRNSTSLNETPDSVSGTSAFSFSLEADGDSTALLRLKESTNDIPFGATTTGEIVLRITPGGDVTMVSDSSTDRTTIVQFGDKPIEPTFAVATAVRKFLTTPSETVIDGVIYKRSWSADGGFKGNQVTSLYVRNFTDILERKYTFDQDLRMVRTDRAHGRSLNFAPSSPDNSGVVSAYPPQFPDLAKVGASGGWFVTENFLQVNQTVVSDNTSGRTKATFSLEPGTDSTALLRLTEHIETNGSVVRTGEIVLRITNAGDFTLESDKAILGLLNPI